MTDKKKPLSKLLIPCATALLSIGISIGLVGCDALAGALSNGRSAPEEGIYLVARSELENQTIGAFMAGAMVGEFVGREIARKMIRPSHVTDKYECAKIGLAAASLFMEHLPEIADSPDNFVPLSVMEMAEMVTQEQLSCGQDLSP